MKMLRLILNRTSVFFAKMAEGLETSQEIEIKKLEIEIKKLKADSADAKDTKLSKKKKKPFRRKYSQVKNITVARKEKLLDAQAKSGISVAQFCRERGLSNSTFYYWQKSRAVAGFRGRVLQEAIPRPSGPVRQHPLPPSFSTKGE